ncbi:MAG: hypothetical protein Kow0042_31580 [Calditrichia bacterium]
MKEKIITRRDFLRDSATAALAGALYLNLPTKVFPRSASKSRVVLVRHRNLLDKLNRPDPALVAKMLDDAVTTLMAVEDPIQAWKQIIRPDDVVGIKSNVWSYLPTPEALERAIVKRVTGAGVAEKNISVNDRGVLSDPIFQRATALINTRPMRTHYWSGVGTLIKNYIMFIKRPSDYHGDTCADLAKIWKLPPVKGKTRLNILVMFTPLFHSVGPHNFNPKYTWAYNGLLVGIDPVAVDATGLRIIQAKRREYFGEERPITPPPKHILLADIRHHLGTADPDKIELIKIGWQEEALI